MGELGAFRSDISDDTPEDYGIGMEFCVSKGDFVTTGRMRFLCLIYMLIL